MDEYFAAFKNNNFSRVHQAEVLETLSKKQNPHIDWLKCYIRKWATFCLPLRGGHFAGCGVQVQKGVSWKKEVNSKRYTSEGEVLI